MGHIDHGCSDWRRAFELGVPFEGLIRQRTTNRSDLDGAPCGFAREKRFPAVVFLAFSVELSQHFPSVPGKHSDSIGRPPWDQMLSDLGPLSECRVSVNHSSFLHLHLSQC